MFKKTEATKKASETFSEFVGLRGLIRGALVATAMYAITPEGQSALQAMGVSPQVAMLVAFIGAAIRNQKSRPAE